MPRRGKSKEEYFRTGGEAFKKNLRIGYKWQEYVAEKIESRGYDTYLPPLEIDCETREDRLKFLNSKDLIVESVPFEIKSLSREFNSPKDFPFPTIIVDTVSGYDGKVEKPLVYIFVSQKTKRMIWTPTNLSFLWEKREIFDNKKNINDNFYCCPKEFLYGMKQLEPLLDYLKEMNKAEKKICL